VASDSPMTTPPLNRAAIKEIPRTESPLTIKSLTDDEKTGGGLQVL